MSQPFDRSARVNQPANLDPTLGEWWVDNPWDIARKGHNLSAYERKRVFLNVRGPEGDRDFVDISALTRADGDGDGRSVVAGDFRNNGQLDLVVRQVGGGPLLLYENRFPHKHYLEVSLRGHRSNREGIGARVTAYVQGRQIVRELYPANSFSSQMPHMVHLGLANDTKVDKLVVRWPSGKVQELANLAADRHVIIDESRSGAQAVETITPGQVIQP
ncbi:MAG TPA: ASPIC/UnbV domain-containing protein [Gemmataceae bacterium]|nr:ASPIC/UnbV domain-containing protein [Gemmataceae bacterium]